MLSVIVATILVCLTGSANASVPTVSAVINCSTPGSKIGPCPETRGYTSEDSVYLDGRDVSGDSGNGPSAPVKSEAELRRDAYIEKNRREAEELGVPYHEPFWVTPGETPPTVVTINDVASFAPAAGGNYMEPNGWIVVGLNTNFYSDASARVVDGTLLGQPAAVRFTPVSWVWSYGDGASTTSANPGASWAALNLAEFEPTATSHVFTNPGSFAIDLTITYSAEYQFGGADWIDISGTLDIPANRIVATASDANTVLVSRDCRQNPGGPGC